MSTNPFRSLLARWLLLSLVVLFYDSLGRNTLATEGGKLRLIIETDAGGDPDDEQALVRFLLYANEWDIEGIIANRPKARDGENLNHERTGLGIVRALLKAYGECYSHLVQNDPQYPKPEQLFQRAVAGYEDTNEGADLIIAAVDRSDSRPVWFSDWGSDHGAATSNLKRALDRVLRERGRDGYAQFKERLRLSSDDLFGEHTTTLTPPFKLWVDTFRPVLGNKRWYHRFSPLTATAGGFDLHRDVLSGHGPLGALYPTNTTYEQKEGDAMTFLYLVPTGMNDPNEPTWGSWAGRYGRRDDYPERPYYWANQEDDWQGTTHRDNTLKRWAVDLQNDFRGRLNWCVKSFSQANHHPVAVVNGQAGKSILNVKASAGSTVELNAAGSSDPDHNQLSYDWFIYPEAGSYKGHMNVNHATSPQASLRVPADAVGQTIHVIFVLRDRGNPPLTSYRRIVIASD